MKYSSSLKLKLIYVFRINDAKHKGCLKIGEATSDSNDITGLSPNCDALKDAARKRINQYTQTAAISYDLLHTELTIFNAKDGIHSFTDAEVHKVLTRSGIKKKEFDADNNANEWYATDLETVKKAIAAVKAGKDSLDTAQITKDRNPVIFRPEQQEAIAKTKKQFKKSNEMLWYAKMRFGKTLSALQVVKELEFTRTLILTHRPVVDAGWFEDFSKIFYDKPEYAYGSKSNGETFENLEKRAKANKAKYVYFASMQDLRGSELVGGHFDKNDKLFAADWDLVIVDEAHEGTQTELGLNVMKNLKKAKTKVLRLSGTPFNLLDGYIEDEIYTWDYVMEQRAKADWDKIHLGDPNPYSSLPRLNIFTFDIGDMVKKYTDGDKAFNFREFFRVNAEGKFIHEADVRAFLNLITKADSKSNYPYSTEEYRNNFRHSLWMVPGVKEAKALSSMLQSHPVFQNFKIVNVAGDGDEEEATQEALEKVKKAITKKPEETYSITISCGRLTTGVSVPAWTAVFMLSGSFNTSAAGYMQTIFRVQTPAKINGRVKEECFVFDFAPDRTLRVIAETAKISAKAGKTTQDDRTTMGEFLNFCPIISVAGSKMEAYNVDGMLEQLKKVYIERVVRNGFEDNYLYNNDYLMKLGKVELNEFDDLKKVIGTTKAMAKTGDIDINNQGFTEEDYKNAELADKKNKAKKELSEDDKRLLKEKEEKKKTRDTAISILRGISIRMPLLIYGADVKNEETEINIDNFTNLVDNKSWEEFMPKGVTKQLFAKFKKYYEPDVFRAAGKRIRAMARAADSLSVEQRIARITSIFGTFRNPDKETVLTPWRVVNMHLGDCLGGYSFFDGDYTAAIENPIYRDHSEVSHTVFAANSRILEINSKSGLYPLYMAYSIYRSRLAAEDPFGNATIEEQLKVWDKTVIENVFVICKTPMARSITKRTLTGFRPARANAEYIEDLVNEITTNAEEFAAKVQQGKSFWKTNKDNNMKFNAIVGNPPYQVMDGGAGASATPIYNKFVDIAKQINPQYISMIMPSRWMTGGKGLDSFRSEMLDDKHITILHDYADAKSCFDNVEIKGGICYFLRDSQISSKCNVFSHKANANEIVKSYRYLKESGDDIFIRDSRLIAIKNKVQSKNEVTFNTIVSSMKPYGLRGDFFNNSEKYNLPKVSITPVKNGLTIIGLDSSMKRVKRYISADYPIPKKEGLNVCKIFIPRNFGSGKMDDSSPNTILAEPGVLCTETFVQIYPFTNKTEMNNCNNYIKTNFFRILLGIKKQDQGAGKDVYQYIPLQDFTASSDIDWSKPIEDIDRQLYAKYGLTAEEVAFIESMIKPMG